MPVSFVDTYTSFLISNKLNDYLSDNKLLDLDRIFDFDRASQDAKSSWLRSVS
jgi:hypothetical protein